LKPEVEAEQEIHALEVRLLSAEVRSSPALLEDLLAEDFVEFGSSGRVFDRRRVIDSLKDDPPTHFALDEFRLQLLAPEIALATYRVVARVGSETEVRRSLRSSVWIRRLGRWVLLFHQGTRSGE
jgi:hypothetical protein